MVDNQHKKITGYRDLTEQEIAAKNAIAEAERALAFLWKTSKGVITQAVLGRTTLPGEQLPGNPHELHESMRQRALARTCFEQGFMHLSRAVLRPVSPWDDSAPGVESKSVPVHVHVHAVGDPA